MSYKPSYVNGAWKADCDVCGRTYKNYELRLRWDNLMCCSQDWEIRQPQDFVRGVADIQAPLWTRPEPPDEFTADSGGGCSTRTSIAGLAIAACMIAGNNINPGSVPSGTFS